MRNVLWAHVVNLTALVGISLTFGAVEAPAACTTPPSASPRFRGTFGTVDSPFLFPGQFRTVDLTGGCTLPPSGPFQPNDVVTLVFTPPSGRHNVVVLKQACEPNWATSPEHQQCVSQLNGGAAVCENGAINAPPGKGTELNFRVPQNLVLTGPVTVAVTAAGAPLPCGLATAQCSNLQGVALRACVDHLYEDQPCTMRHATFPGVTALPSLKDFSRLCRPDSPGQPSPCRGDDPTLKFAIDAYGNILIPMDWSPIPCGPGQPCNKCDVYASTAVAALPPPNAQPIQLPNSEGLGSFNLYGQQFARPPKFKLGSPKPNELSLEGDVDKPASVLRIARCPGGANCPTGFFDFRNRMMDGGVGPISIDGTTTGARVCDGGGNDGTLCTTNPGLCGPDVPCVAVRGRVRCAAP